MLRNVWGDPDRYTKSYFPEELGGKLYLAGDGAVRDEDTGYFTIAGRIDDMLNVSGHRLGTMEMSRHSSLIRWLRRPLSSVALTMRPARSSSRSWC
jgi:acyl-coenzyme A synthetase/AMP-(fatty) acid ligase